MFLGQHHQKFNSKNQLELPSLYKELLYGGGFVMQGFDRNLLVLTNQAFQEIYERVIGMNIADPRARLLSRMILGTAAPLRVDDAGSILVPQGLRDFASLEGEAVLIGQGTHFEIWAPSEWAPQVANIQDVDANAQRFAEFDLAAR
jgi:MraZ protein